MKYTDRVMNIVKDALSRMEQITGQIKELDRRFKAEEISGVDYQAQKAELEKQLGANRLDAAQKLQEAVGSAMSTVPEQYREILRLRYWEDMTLEDIGELRGVSKERVRQMENKGIRLLRQPRNACHLRPFHDFDFYCHTSLSAFNQTGMSVQERYLVIEEERKEREAKERKRRDEEWQRRVEESRRWFAERQARRAQEIEDAISQMTPEEKQELLAKYGYA